MSTHPPTLRPEPPRELLQEAPAGGFMGLAEYLKREPRAIAEPPARLARLFGLEEETVVEVIGVLSRPALQPQRRIFRELLAEGWQHVQNLWQALTQRMDRVVPFMLGTTAMFIGVFLFAELIRVTFPGTRGHWIFSTVLISFLISIFLAHVVCIFRQGRMRIAWLSTGLFSAKFGVIGLTLLLENLLGRGDGLDYALFLLSIPLVGLLMMLMLTPVSLLGSFLNIRRDAHELDSLTRQEALNRLFAVREKLDTLKERRSENKPKNKLLEAFQRWPQSLISGTGLILLFTVVSTLIMSGFETLDFGGTIAVIVSGLFFGFGGFALYGLLAYLAGTIPRAVITALVTMIAGTLLQSGLMQLLPMPSEMTEQQLSVQVILTIVFALLVGCFAGIGAVVEQRAKLVKQKISNDPAYIVAEYVRLNWFLSPSAKASVIMDVDVARSTAMKAAADPHVVEWTFRRYQDWLAEIIQLNQGNIINVAGDGTIAAFTHVSQAMAAAKTIQSSLPAFNRDQNRINRPFRVRVGIHMGDIQGNVTEVQFSETIDIAAHVQKVAPVGGIAITQPVASELPPTERIARMSEYVDGQDVFFVLNPTQDV